MSPCRLHFFGVVISLGLVADAYQQRRSSILKVGTIARSGGSVDGEKFVPWWEQSLIPADTETKQVAGPVLVESVQHLDDETSKPMSPLEFVVHWLQYIFRVKTNAQVVTKSSLQSSLAFGSLVWEPVDCGYPSVAGLVLEVRVKKFEDASLQLLLRAICPTCDQMNVTSSLAYADHLNEAIKECEINSKEVLASRVERIRGDLASAASHRNSLLSGTQDADGVYTLSDSSSFSPSYNCSSAELVEWFLAKVAGMESLSQRAIDSKQGLDEAYHYARRLSLAMIRVLSLHESMDAKDSEAVYSKNVIQTLRQRVEDLKVLLRSNGAQPSAIVEAMSGTNGPDDAAPVVEAFPLVQVSFEPWMPVDCSQLGQARVILEERVKELESKSLVSMLAAICVNCDHKSVDNTFALLRHLQNTLHMCPVTGRKVLLARVNAVEVELVRASHHKNLVAVGKDPYGFYALDNGTALSPKAGTPPIKAAQFFIGKVASFDFMMRKAITNGEGLDEAYHYAHRVTMSMTRFLSQRSNVLRNNVEVARARSVITALQSHMQNVQKVLREHGAQPGGLQPPREQ